MVHCYLKAVGGKMLDKIKQEEDWIFHSEKSFNFIRIIANFVETRGGSFEELDRIFDEPDLVDEIADVLVGKSKITERDPVEIICRTGRTSSVKAQAALKISSDKDRISVLYSCTDPLFIKNIIKGMEDQKYLFSWYQNEANENRHHWSTTEDLSAVWKTIIESFSDEDLLWIVKVGHHWDATAAIEAIKSQSILKSLMNDPETLKRLIDLTGLSQTLLLTVIIKRITDIDFLNNWMENELSKKKVGMALMQNLHDRVRALIDIGIREEEFEKELDRQLSDEVD